VIKIQRACFGGWPKNQISIGTVSVLIETVPFFMPVTRIKPFSIVALGYPDGDAAKAEWYEPEKVHYNNY
jgi:hypothetical protein